MRDSSSLGVDRSLNKTYEGRPKNVLFQETLLQFFRANSLTHSLHFFFVLDCYNFFKQRLFLLILFIFFLFFFCIWKFFKLASISSNTNLKRDIACVLVVFLLHVVGAVASVICHRRGVCLIEPEHDKKQQMTCAPSEDSNQPGHQPSLISLCWVL